jgi:hypothetical protein
MNKNYVVSNGRITVNEEMVKMWKEGTCCKVLYQYMLGYTEENNEKPQPG